MFKWYKEYRERRKAEIAEIARVQYEAEVMRQKEISDFNCSIGVQSKLNVSYIQSVIQTLTSNINSIQVRGSDENKEKKRFLENKLSWYKSKLVEEMAMANYYGVI